MNVTITAPPGPQRVIATEQVLRALRDIGYDVTMRVAGQPHHATYFSAIPRCGMATIMIVGGANVR